MEIIEKEVIKDEKKEYASKGVAGTALGLGIAGTALGLLNGGLGLFGLNPVVGSSNSSCNLTCEDKIELTSAIYQGRITELQERFGDRQVIDREMFGLYKSQVDADFGLYKSTRDSFDALNAKHNADAFALYKNQRDSFDVLASRISALETKQAVDAAIEPWRAQVLSMQINGVASNAQAAVALEAERRCCADGKIVNYVNSTFYPKLTADVTVGTTTTAMNVYNPLCNCCVPNL